jgi:aminoglycoside 3-N-acetyltransferase
VSEKKPIQDIDSPRTRATLAADLRALGLEPGMTVLVHSSLSAIGYVVGAAVAVVQALMDVLTPDGTLVMPTHTSENSEPSYWRHPPVPEAWWPIIRETMPAFDPAITPTRQMGRIVETFRAWPGVQRSNHPALSFAAWGRLAAFVTADHGLEYSLGEQSPLARVYDLDGFVLLLGVGHANNTSLHLGEFRAGSSPDELQGAALLEDGQRVWKTYRDTAWDDDPFPEIGAAFDATGQTRIGHIGSAESRLFRQRAAVNFAQQWLAARAASMGSAASG